MWQAGSVPHGSDEIDTRERWSNLNACWLEDHEFGGENTVPESNPSIDAVVVVDSVGKTQLYFESVAAAADNASELWWEPNTSNYFLYHPDEFYDDSLRQRRNENLMYSPKEPTHHLVFVGLVWGAPAYDKSSTIISRSRVQFSRYS